MIIEAMKNPMVQGAYENVVVLTMTKDQFHMLKDCVSLAWQSANQNSRMFKISTLIRDDFEKLDIEAAYKGDRQ